MAENRILSLEDVLSLNESRTAKLFASHVNPGLVRILKLFKVNRHIVKAEGIRVWDDNGTEYLDFLCSYGALALGHNHPEVLAAVNRLASYPNLLQISLSPVTAALAANLAAITPGDLNRSFFCNSGSEAVEAAIKLVRAATKRTAIVCAEGGFHGKSMGALSATGHKPYKTTFEPLVPDFHHVPFNDIDAMEEAFDRYRPAAVILEPIQGPAGIVVPDDGYLAAVRRLCTDRDVLLVLDEIQTGFGRTGRLFACEHESVVPDVLCLSKALGGGVFPIGACVTSDRIWDRAYGSGESYLLHTSTFGGNTLACGAGIAAVGVIVREDLAARANDEGEYFRSSLHSMVGKSKLLKSVRGKGLMVGLDFSQGGGLADNTAALIAAELLKRHHIILLYTFNNPNVIRLAPPLNTERKDLERLLEGMEDVLTRNRSFLSLAGKAALNVLK